MTNPEVLANKLEPKVEIIVNGRSREVAKEELSYSDVVLLAFENASFTDTTIYTVTYKRGGNPQRPEGVMVNGDIVKVKKGMVFNVTATDKS